MNVKDIVLVIGVLFLISCKNEKRSNLNDSKLISDLELAKEIDKFNSNDFVVVESNEYRKLLNNNLVKQTLIQRADLNKTLKNTEMDSLSLYFKGDSLVIKNIFFLSAVYGKILKVEKKDTRIDLKTIDVGYFDKEEYLEDTANYSIIDVSIASFFEIQASIKMEKDDFKKTIYFNNKNVNNLIK